MNTNTFLEHQKSLIIKTFGELVKIPSVPENSNRQISDRYPYGTNAAKALNYCKDVFSAWGFTVKEYQNHCIKISLDGKSGSREILFAAHSDVVHTDEDNIYNAFLGEIVNGYMIGRGSVDDKGPLIAIAYAFKYLKEISFCPQNTFSLLVGSNEEGGMSDIDYYLRKEKQPLVGISVDDDFPVVNGENTKYTFKIIEQCDSELIGISQTRDLRRHSPFKCSLSYKKGEFLFESNEKNPNPLLSLLDFCKEKQFKLFHNNKYNDFIFREFTEGAGLFDLQNAKLSPTSLALENGNLSLEFVLTVNPLVEREKVFSLMNTMEESYNLPIKLVKENKGYFHEENQPLVKLLTDVYNKNSGTDYKPYIMNGSTYARKFDFGLGFGAGNPKDSKPFPKGHGSSHGPDEAQSMDVLFHAIDIYVKAIEEIDRFYSSN